MPMCKRPSGPHTTLIRYNVGQVNGASKVTDVDLQEKLAHIDQMLADHDRKRQEIRLAPWALALSGMTAGAALFAAGAAFMKLFS